MTSILVALVLTGAWPKNMSVNLAGFSLNSERLVNVARHDSNSGWFAFYGMDCDGSHRSIRLTKDRRILEAVGVDMRGFGRAGDGLMKVEEHPFTPSSGVGITPGMSQATVLKRLGTPTYSKRIGAHFWSAMYKKIDHGQVLRNIYICKDDKLVEVLYRLDRVPGCGDDSLSDAGWPWTTF